MTGKTVSIRANQALALPPDQEMMDVLRSSLYPGAKDESIKLVIGYCKAAGLDPMQKPVHIVPMWDSKTQTLRDTVMPGIGLYRTQAARSGQFAGVSEPEFGPDVKEKIGGHEITYPAWCRVKVLRQLPTGQIAEFTAVERWMENYAVKGGKEKSIAPNAMWTRRPYAQLAKCAEAQALRKAFPEVGAQPTAEEMEGKHLDDDTVIDHATGEFIQQPRAKTPTAAPAATPNVEGATPTPPASTVSQPAAPTGLTENQIKVLRERLAATSIEEKELCHAFSVPELVPGVLELFPGVALDIKEVFAWCRKRLAEGQ